MNIYESITNRVVEALENGTKPWKKPWVCSSLAYNTISKRNYSLLNQMLLKHSGEYATFSQWTDLGCHIKHGEVGERIVFWKHLVVQDKKNPDLLKDIPMLKYYIVFALLFFSILFYIVTTLCSYSDIFELSELVQYIIYFGILFVVIFVACCLAWTIYAVPAIDRKYIAAKQNQQKLLQSAQNLTDLITLQENLKCTFASNKDWQACVTIDHVYLFESKGSVIAVLKEFELPSGVVSVEDPYSLDFSIIDSMYQELSVKVASWNK